MTEFGTWKEARAYAEAKAREVGQAYGIEKPVVLRGKRVYCGWTVKMLPGRPFRRGWELLCEAVEPPLEIPPDCL